MLMKLTQGLSYSEIEDILRRSKWRLFKKEAIKIGRIIVSGVHGSR